MKSKVFVVMAVLAMANAGFAALVMHLNADSLGLADSAAVATWTDLSGNSNDATQGTAGAQPTYVASNAAFNGHATVSFDRAGSNYMNLNGSIIAVNNFTLFIVGNFDATGFEQYIISAQGGSGNDRLRVANYGWGGATDEQVVTRIGNTGDKHLGYVGTDAFVVAVTGTAAAWLNLGDKQTVGNNTAGALNPSHFRLGAYDNGNGTLKAFFGGDLAEVRLYNEILSDNDVAAMNAQLYATYIPEPATMVLLGLGALVLRRRK